jgi:hypothetical protein
VARLEEGDAVKEMGLQVQVKSILSKNIHLTHFVSFYFEPGPGPGICRMGLKWRVSWS